MVNTEVNHRSYHYHDLYALHTLTRYTQRGKYWILPISIQKKNLLAALFVSVYTVLQQIHNTANHWWLICCFTIELCINFGILHCFLAQLDPNHLPHPLQTKAIKHVTACQKVHIQYMPEQINHLSVSQSFWTNMPLSCCNVDNEAFSCV